jgi:hypothetical protein
MQCGKHSQGPADMLASDIQWFRLQLQDSEIVCTCISSSETAEKKEAENTLLKLELLESHNIFMLIYVQQALVNTNIQA